MLNKDIFTFYTAFVDGRCDSCNKKLRVPLRVSFEHEIIEEPSYKCFCKYNKKIIDEIYKQRDELETEEFKTN